MLKYSFLILLLIPSIAFCKTPKTFPTSPVTVLRLDTYQDVFDTMWDSTATITTGNWIVFGETQTLIQDNQTVWGFQPILIGTTTAIVPVSWTIQQYTDQVIEQTKLETMNEVLDDGVEEFMVWPDTSPPEGWQGWCGQTLAGGAILAITCP